MNDTFKIIKSGIIAFAFLFVAYFLIVFFSTHSDTKDYKNYLWIFKDSVKNEIIDPFSSSYSKSCDVFNVFHIRDFRIIIWEFKDMKEAELKDVSFHENILLDQVIFFSGETLGKKSDLETTIKFRCAFNNFMGINLDKTSKIVRKFESHNYKGFYGNVNVMSFSDENYDHQILMKYVDGSRPTVFLTYKSVNGFYIIIINRVDNIEQPFDENAIGFLNLN